MLAGGVKNLDSTTLGFPVGAEMGLRHVMAISYRYPAIINSQRVLCC